MMSCNILVKLAQFYKLGAASMLMLLVAACASPSFKADINRYQQLPAPQGQSFVITTDNPKLKGGIEFSQYAAIVEQELIAAGYVSSRDPDSADMIVNFDYMIDNGREKVRSTAGSAWGGWGPYNYGGFGYYGGVGGHYWPYYNRRYRYGFYDPFIYGAGYGGYGGYGNVRSYTVYTSRLRMNIDRKADNYRLFEGQAIAQSRSDNLQYLIPNLVEALFTDFPGNSGETIRVSIAPEETKVTRLSPRQ